MTAVFLIFIFIMTLSLFMDITMILPLALGFVLFTLAAVQKGFRLKEVLAFAAGSLKDSFIVIGILLLIGCLTGMWRLSGTVAYFITLGISVIPPQLFVLAAFLLASAMSYALGTSFGVTATAGVILMSIARAGGVNPVLAAGAVLSGVYVGDRGSLAASSGNLVAVLTGTDMRKNVREMLKCSIVPFIICCAAYGALSSLAPMQSIDAEILGMLHEEFSLNWFCIIPAVVMIILPFCGVSIKLSMLFSLISSASAAVFVQHYSLQECLAAMILGFQAKNEALQGMLSGGGVVSMVEVCIILVLSCSYGEIFRGTGMLSGINKKLEKLSAKIGRFPTMLLMAIALAAVFCNQTIGAIMQSNLSATLYGQSEEERMNKMLDVENSIIMIAGLVPWCIACSVPLGMMGAGAASLPFAFYLWLLPLWWAIRRLGGKKVCIPSVDMESNR